MKNYFGYSFYLSLSTFVLLALLWFTPSVEGEVFALRKVNIVSQVVSESDIHQILGLSRIEDLDLYEPEMMSCSPFYYNIEVPIIASQEVVPPPDDPTSVPQPKQQVEAVKTNSEATATQVVTASKYVPVKQEDYKVEAPHQVSVGELTPIELGADANFQRFVSKLRGGRKVRISVVGDSFIEGDIFTQDLREKLQSRYGGEGVGYVPITSQVAGFRRSVGHSFSGWTTSCVLNNPSSGPYHLSGYVFTPSEGAWVHYKGSTYKSHLATFSTATLLFINKANTKITVKVNDSIVREFTPASSDQLQKVTVRADSDGKIQTVRFQVTNVSGFKAYGAVLDGDGGVSVDNYSIRSYSGSGLSKIPPTLALQANDILHSDLVIMQYGLNVASAKTVKYQNFAENMAASIRHLQQIMPATAILVMSVSDRQDRRTGQWTTMPGITAMEQTQRGVAAQCGVAFWSTLNAMQNAGGMSHFVQKGWAAKDYTHLSSSGGRVVADKLVNALLR